MVRYIKESPSFFPNDDYVGLPLYKLLAKHDRKARIVIEVPSRVESDFNGRVSQVPWYYADMNIIEVKESTDSDILYVTADR